MTAPNPTARDLIVVGGGGSGLAAAVSAAETGARVTVLEAGELLRGSTAMSVGSIAAAGTPDQRRLGIEDRADDHFRDYQTLSGPLAAAEDPRLVRLLVDHVADTVAWLRRMGVEFFGPVGEPPHSAPRLLTVLPGSRSYIYHLRRRARQLGVEVLLGHRMTELIVEDGRVVGVRASHDGVAGEFRARHGVILASGDFSASQELKRAWISERVAGFEPVNRHAQGDAQRLVLEHGGEVLNAAVFDVPSIRLAPPAGEGLYGLLQRLPPRRWLTGPMLWAMRHLPSRIIRTLLMGFVTTYLSPREALFEHGAILVDLHGSLRSSAEENINLSVAGLGAEGGYVIGDERLRKQFSGDPDYVATAPGVARAYMPDFQRGRKDVYTSSDTIEGLAKRLGIRDGALSAAVESANRAAAEAGRPPIGAGPYFALGPVRGYLLQTNGGLRISDRLEVVDRTGTPIPGLYAVGNAGQGGLALFGHGHHLGWAFTSGRLAGRIALGAPLPGPHRSSRRR